MEAAMQAATSPAPMILVLLLLVGVVIGFVALFKSGKRETALDAKLDAIANDADIPSAIRSLAAKAKGLELTKAATDVNARFDSLEAQVKALIDKVK